jgi:aryl-alcohol dehydrogenase-like predicted oxidoreductase
MIRSEEEGDEERSFALLDEVFAQGGTTFDTAHQYGGGDCERTLGRWVRDRGLRDEVVIIGKGAHHNEDRKRVTPFDITGDLYDSLARLESDYIDLYLLHRDDPSVPVGPIVEVLNEHKEEGRIQAFGGSNWRPERCAKRTTTPGRTASRPWSRAAPTSASPYRSKSPGPTA